MTKLRHLEPYGFNEQPQFNGLVNTVKANIENIKKKNEEQDEKDEAQDKKDEEQDENIKQAIDKSVVSLELLSTPTEGSNRTYAVKQGGNEIGKIEIPFSSLVKSTTYDAENNLLIFTVDNDKEIKVNLTDLIEDADLVQRRIFDDFKNEVNSFSSNTTDSISELVQKLGSGFTGANTVTSVIERNEKVVSASLNDLNDRKLDASAYTPTDLSDYYKKEETSGKTDIDKALASKANASDLTTHISDNIKHITSDERTKWNNAKAALDTHTGDSAIHITADERSKWNGKISNVQYNNNSIKFYSGATTETPVSTIDVTPFIKDGMVSNVEIKNVASSGSCLVITFNTDANKQDINIPVSTIFNPSNYYLKTETSGATELNTAFGLKANQSDLTAHTGNNDIHVTSDDKTRWNNAATSSHTHANKAILDSIATIDTELSATSNNLVVNSAITKVILENEKIVSTSLNDLNDRKLDSSAYTPTDLSDYYKKEETSAKTELTTAFNLKANSADLTAHISDNIKHITSDERTKWNGKLSNVQYSKTDKKIYFYSGATTETPVLNIDATDFIKDGMVSKVEIKDVTDSGSCLVITFNADAGNQVITIPVSKIFDSGKYYLKTETSGKTEISGALALKADTSALTAHNGNNDIHITTAERTKWNNAADKSHVHTNKNVLDKITAIDTELSKTSNNLVVNSAITKVIVENEKVVSSALNDLNDRKLDSSAYTPTDLSDYCKKEETSGKTELDAALAKKANTSDLASKANTDHTHTSNDITDIVTAITDSNSGSTSVPTVNAVMQELNSKISQLNTLITNYESRIAALESKNSNNASQS